MNQPLTNTMNASPVRRVVISAGGTGGHIFPALAVANVLRKKGVEVSWIGTSAGMESRIVPEHGIDMDYVDVAGLRGNGVLGWLKAPLRLLRATRACMKVLNQRDPVVVLGLGGFVTGPVGVASWLRGIPLVIHEQNAVSGLTNRLLARIATRLLEAFPGALHSKNKPYVTGNPVRQEIADLADPALRLDGRSGPVRLLVLGGSLGAKALNEVVPEALARMPETLHPVVRHQAGKATLDLARQKYEDLGLEAEVTEFIDDMAEAYGWADYVICRAGALTVAELAAAGLPAILVPFPHAVDDHQTANALYLTRQGAAMLCPQPECKPPLLAARMTDMSKRSRRLNMAAKARALALSDAATVVADHCLEVAKGNQ